MRLYGAGHYLSAGGVGRGGLGNFRGAHEKNSTTNEGGGLKISYMNPSGDGVANVIFVSFSGIKMLYLLTLYPIINFLNLSCPTFHHHHHRKMKT